MDTKNTPPEYGLSGGPCAEGGGGGEFEQVGGACVHARVFPFLLALSCVEVTPCHAITHKLFLILAKRSFQHHMWLANLLVKQ